MCWSDLMRQTLTAGLAASPGFAGPVPGDGSVCRSNHSSVLTPTRGAFEMDSLPTKSTLFKSTAPDYRRRIHRGVWPSPRGRVHVRPSPPLPQPRHPPAFLPFLDISRQRNPAPRAPMCLASLSHVRLSGLVRVHRGEHCAASLWPRDTAVCVTTSGLSAVCWWTFWLGALFGHREQSCRDVCAGHMGRACWPCDDSFP